MNQPLALVTGGSRGLGRSMALKLAGQGIDVLFTYRDRRTDADAVLAGIDALGRKAVALQLDISDSGSFASFTDQVQATLAATWQAERFDFLVNNAGVGAHATFSETTEAQLDEMLRIHLKGPFFLTQRLLPLIADGGRIVNITTGLTRFSFPGYAAYAIAKGGLEVLTRYMAREFGERGIVVNSLAPGAIETDFGGGTVRDDPEVNQRFASMTALGRVGLPEDIGDAVASLLTSPSRWINGQRIEASGGFFL